MSGLAGAPRTLFLDRDGVINADTGYVHRWEDFCYLPGAVQALQLLHRAGWQLVVVTNQSGIARGLYTEAQYQALTQRLRADLAVQGAALLDVLHCPHHPDGVAAPFAVACDCRKPAPGLLLRAAARHGIDLARATLVGDRGSDIAAARSAGVGRAYLVGADAGNDLHGSGQGADGRFADLLQCAYHLLHTPA